MATATIPNTFTNGTNADANLVNANFSYLSSWLNTNAIQPSVANFSVFPTLPSSAPTSDYQAVHKNYVDLFMPAGVITQYVGSSAPNGWRLCDGTLYNGSDSTYARLWAAVGTQYGGSGIGSFAVPDMRSRVPVGLSSETEFDTLGKKAGAKDGIQSHNHTYSGTVDGGGAHAHGDNTGNAGSHAHTLLTQSNSVGTHGHGNTGRLAVASSSNTPVDQTYDTPSAGAHAHTISSQAAHNHTFSGTVVSTGTASGNLQPYIVVNYIIKL
jgi:microcystin-dependent protein